MATLPKKIKVGPYNISIGLDDLSVAEAYGYFSPNRLQIKLDEQPELEVKQEALLHEILHAIWFTAGLEKRVEEESIKAISPHLLRVLRENPGVLKYLLDGC